jgi:hypothetical protein
VEVGEPARRTYVSEVSDEFESGCKDLDEALDGVLRVVGELARYADTYDADGEIPGYVLDLMMAVAGARNVAVSMRFARVA